MAINIAHRPDLDRQVERLAALLGLFGRGRKVRVIETALNALEESAERIRPDRNAIRASLQRFAAGAPRLRDQFSHRTAKDGRPLSLTLQEELYDDRGLPK